MKFDWSKLNEPESKTFFEIISSRMLIENHKMITFKTFFYESVT